jgi:hypothetical protein
MSIRSSRSPDVPGRHRSERGKDARRGGELDPHRSISWREVGPPGWIRGGGGESIGRPPADGIAHRGCLASGERELYRSFRSCGQPISGFGDDRQARSDRLGRVRGLSDHSRGRINRTRQILGGSVDSHVVNGRDRPFFHRSSRRCCAKRNQWAR